ncbi:MAG: dienelactone hydrolase family protein [Verrucomicrobia subdivision 3 bacterium]|nr:dienelactone hydrolase family protein [Limisphaerales bacterium]
MKFHCILICGLLLAIAVRGEVVSKPVEYKEGRTTLEGLWVHDDSTKGKRPGVLVVHQWKGLGAYEKKRADMLAQLGYNVFAVDIYGKGIRHDNPKDASAEAAKYKNDRKLLRARVNAGLDVLKKQELTDAKRVAAIGYCFGGTTVLELARSGADVAAVVSFHGGLATPNPADAKQIKAKVLALHGADDPHVPPAEVAGFEKEMRDAMVDWTLVAYGNSVHSFTDWNAGNDNSKGSAYNEKADKRSWEAMKQFFAEAFK